MALADLLLNSNRFNALLRDCVQLLEREVGKKKGLAGLAVKTSFGVVKQFKPDVLDEAFTRLLPKFIEKLEPFHQHFQNEGQGDFSTFLRSKASEVSNALLSVTDQRATESQITVLKKAYEKLRPAAQQHVKDAVPALANLVDKYQKMGSKE